MAKRFEDIFVALDQVGIIVPDAEHATLSDNMKDILGFTDEQVGGGGVTHHPNTFYRGTTFNPGPGVRMSFFDKFGVQLEYLSATDGYSIWKDYENKVEKGIHHIRFDVASHEDAIAYMAEKGIPLYHAGDSVRGGGVKFAYFDAYDKLGFYIETLNLTEVARKNAKED